MFRYKIVACILLILPVFSFVLAAPVAVQEVHEARIDGSRKRAEEYDPLLAEEHGPSSSSYLWSLPSKYQETSSSAAGDHKPLLAQVKGPSSSSNFWSIPSENQPPSSVPKDTSKVHPNLSSPPEGEATIFKNILSKPKFWRRISGTTSGVVTGG